MQVLTLQMKKVGDSNSDNDEDFNKSSSTYSSRDRHFLAWKPTKIWITNMYQSKHTRQKSLPEVHETMKIHDTKVRPTTFNIQTNFNHITNKQSPSIMSTTTWRPRNDATYIDIKDIQLLMKEHHSRWTLFNWSTQQFKKWKLTGIRY